MCVMFKKEKLRHKAFTSLNCFKVWRPRLQLGYSGHSKVNPVFPRKSGRALERAQLFHAVSFQLSCFLLKLLYIDIRNYFLFNGGKTMIREKFGLYIDIFQIIKRTAAALSNAKDG